jgi:uncharacterized protein (TIGR02145 family)
MKRTKTIVISGVFILLLSYGNISGNFDQPAGSKSDQTSTKSVQTSTKSAQTKTKSAQTKKKTPAKPKTVQKSPVTQPAKDDGTITIGTQKWAVANLSVSTFRNGDSIPEAKTYKEWVAAGESGKPAWCYYNNNPANGPKYGRLYNWYAVYDPRGLAPAGWVLSSDSDWAKLVNFLGGQAAAGRKMKSLTGWVDGNNGNNECGFNGMPGGYRIENGLFQNLGSIGTWWSSTESKTLTAYDHYLTQGGSLDQSSTPKQRGESVRCLKE